MSMQEEVERAETAGKAAEGVSRRRFLQGAAVIGASVVAMRGEAAGQVVGSNSAAAEASMPSAAKTILQKRTVPKPGWPACRRP